MNLVTSSQVWLHLHRIRQKGCQIAVIFNLNWLISSVALGRVSVCKVIRTGILALPLPSRGILSKHLLPLLLPLRSKDHFRPTGLFILMNAVIQQHKCSSCVTIHCISLQLEEKEDLKGQTTKHSVSLNVTGEHTVNGVGGVGTDQLVSREHSLKCTTDHSWTSFS